MIATCRDVPSCLYSHSFVIFRSACHLTYKGCINIQDPCLGRYQDVALGDCPQTALLRRGRRRQICAATGVVEATARTAEASGWRSVSSAFACESKVTLDRALTPLGESPSGRLADIQDGSFEKDG